MFRLFDEYDRQAFRNVEHEFSARSFTPKFDVKETKDSYELHGELPGIEQKNINIEWSDSNTITISGRHEHVREEGQRPQTQGFIESEGSASSDHQPKVEDDPSDKSSNGGHNKLATTTTTHSQHQPTSVAKRNENQTRYWVSERSVGEFHRSFAFPARVDQDAVKASLKNGILSILVPKSTAPQTRKVNIDIE